MTIISKLLTSILVIIIGAAYAVAFYLRELQLQNYFGFSQNDENTRRIIIRVSLLSGFTLIGILTKVLYDQVNREKEEGFSLMRAFGKAFSSKQAWLAIIISPIIIIGFYKQIESIESYPLICILAYQNGFFFKSILHEKINPSRRIK